MTWNFNGLPVPGATNPTFTRANVQYTNAGTVSVTVVNLVGSVASQPAQLLVSPTILPGFALTNGLFQLRYEATPGQPVVFERATSLFDWSGLSTNASPTGTGQFTDPASGAAGPRTYRLRVAP